MDLTAINNNAALHAPAPAIPANQATEDRDIVQAVKAVNGAELFGQGNQLTIQRDPQTQRMVLKIVNQQTKEVVAQVPADSVLRLAEDLKQPEYVVSLSQDRTKKSG
jgi:uncharacterized FlaG/YvyC family protein